MYLYANDKFVHFCAKPSVYWDLRIGPFMLSANQLMLPFFTDTIWLERQKGSALLHKCLSIGQVLPNTNRLDFTSWKVMTSNRFSIDWFFRAALSKKIGTISNHSKLQCILSTDCVVQTEIVYELHIGACRPRHTQALPGLFQIMHTHITRTERENTWSPAYNMCAQTYI